MLEFPPLYFFSITLTTNVLSWCPWMTGWGGTLSGYAWMDGTYHVILPKFQMPVIILALEIKIIIFDLYLIKDILNFIGSNEIQ